MKNGVFTRAQAGRGERLYASYCANCHAADLSGGDLAPALAGEQFASNWNGLPLRDLLERIKTTMPQDSPDSLSGQQYADILAFMLQTAGLPPGQSELPPDAAALEKIKYSAGEAAPR